MDPETENDAKPGNDSTTPEITTPELSLRQQLLQRVRRMRRSRLIMVAAAGVLMMALAAWTILGMFTSGDSASDDTALESSPQPTRIAFHVAVAQTVQTSDDTIWLHDFLPTTEQLETLTCIERLRVLRIDNGSLTPQAGKVFASMPHLEQLHFRDVSLDDATLDEIAKSQTIWLVNIAGAKLSPEAIARLTAMPELSQLRLAMENGGNRYAESIAGIKKLRSLHLVGFGINNQSLKLLADLPNLESLYIDDSNVNEDGWKWLFENKTHLHVHVDQKHHDRDPQKH
jgi:hypothetical protein